MNNKEVVTLKIAELVPFKEHPFKPLSEERLNELSESIKANGVLLPLIVRPTQDGSYEILSGHNRVEAAKRAGLDEIPAIIREGLTDDEAVFIVTETNLLQRSFSEMSQGEKAAVINNHYAAMKSQGRRQDLIDDVEGYVSENLTSSKIRRSSKTRENLAEIFGMSAATISLYVRADMLCAALKKRFDDKEFAVSVAANLSFLNGTEQAIIDEVLSVGGKVNNQKANALRKLSAAEKFDAVNVAKLINADRKRSAPKLALNKKSFEDLFQEGQTEEDLAEEMRAAVAYYRKLGENHQN